ncbi:hypothetical protein PCANC_14040 [Puccinia coronata f. sp. avenae]|uniref:Uncharacterized protein n=1 Tax=Puccinia coronata f. sp. avenae TaxID=200324 RepID=A0A2N5VRL2_9BASI|nr:hypothetical protein PCANC_14040 [Puccinia coronata f. sp. avenae]
MPGNCPSSLNRAYIDIPPSFVTPSKPANYKPPKAWPPSSSGAGKPTQSPAGCAPSNSGYWPWKTPMFSQTWMLPQSPPLPLKFSGANYTLWERQINTTLDFVFHTDSFLSLNSWLLLNPDHRPLVMIFFRSTVDQVLSTNTATAKTPVAIYQLLRN